MKYKGDDYQMCDAWFLNVNDIIHVFNLKLPDGGKPKNVAHVYTKDLLHFTKCDDFLNPFSKDVNPDDCNDHGTGCAITNPVDGKHYIYYTMLNYSRDQKIGLLTSEDLTHFEYSENNPILEIDTDIFCEHMQAGTGTDCRDMIIIYDDVSKLYYGYFAAMAKGETPVGAIGVAQSCDLIHWDNQSIVYKARFDGVIEVPDVYYLDGKWYLTILTHSSFGAYGTMCDKNVVSGTIYASADGPKGPFVEADDNIFIGGTHQSGYTCRTFLFHGKRYVMYIDKSEYGWAVSLPKEVKVIDGNLRPCYTPILKQMRIKTAISDLSAGMLDKKSSAMFWDISSGTVEHNLNSVLLRTNPYTYQYYMIKNIKMQSAEIEYCFTSANADGGIVLESSEKYDTEVNTYFIMAEISETTLSVYKGGLNFELCCRRKFNFESGRKYLFRIIAQEGQIEVYVDDILIIQNALKTANSMRVGLICGKGSCQFDNFKAYELEK